VTKKHGFASVAQNTAKLAGSSSAFAAACLITFVWLVTGPIFHWSDTWQLVINTVTNIVSMLMVFIIQNTQNRESAALQLKIDELLRAARGAQNSFINLEEVSEGDLDDLKAKSAALADRARLKTGQSQAPGKTASRTGKRVP
jgi:low affinity Fe/Cu permease